MNHSPPLPLPLFSILPPYDHADALASGGTVDRPPGRILALHLTDPASQWTEAASAIPTLRATWPESPLVLLVDSSAGAAMMVAPLAVRLGVRALVVAGPPLHPQLLPPLTRTLGLGPDVVEWLALRGLTLTPVLSRIVSEMFERAPAAPRVSRLLSSLGETDITVRRRFRKRLLAPPVAWLRAARGLHVALRLQAEPWRPLLEVSSAMGFADHSALCQVLWRAFRLRPREVRGTLGWEWILSRVFQQLSGCCFVTETVTTDRPAH